MSDTPDYDRVIAECLVYPQEPPKELIAVVQKVLAAPAEPSREQLKTLNQQLNAHPRRLALVHGGATKIKGYVFEAPKLPEIRGASALLDWVGEQQIHQIWHAALPQKNRDANQPHPYIIYASGGSFLAFAPCDKAQELATKVERAYTEHTLTANSVAVAACFDLLEIRFGRLFNGEATDTFYWIEDFLQDCKDEHKWNELKSYYYHPKDKENDKSDAVLKQRFFNRKTFGELVTVLATMFHRRRDERASHGEPRCLPHYELIPWAVKCQSSDVRPAVINAHIGSDTRQLSEASARKLAVGRLVKGADVGGLEKMLKPWQLPQDLRQKSWESRWQTFLEHHAQSHYATKLANSQVKPASDLSSIGAASKPSRYIGLIYADGNNIGRLMATLNTPEIYHKVSRALSEVAEQAVFTALAQHLEPVNGVHPFEILTIGGDDLFIIVPGDKAFDIALMIGQHFEEQLTTRLDNLAQTYNLSISPPKSTSKYLRYNPSNATTPFLPLVGLSAGVLIAQENTPFFFLRDLVEELLKKAKKLAKQNADKGFFGGAIDFMVLKSIGMVSDNIDAFRAEALQDYPHSPRRLTARPYMWAEFAGLLTSIRALKQANAPRSQLYRIQRVLLRNRTAGIFDSAMEYLYTRSRLRDISTVLIDHIEHPWHWPSTSAPQRVCVPPWSSRPYPDDKQPKNHQYETIWPDLLEAYDFVPTKQ